MDKLLLNLQHSTSQINEALMWHWAFEHPYLFFFMKITPPSILGMAAYCGLAMIARRLKR